MINPLKLRELSASERSNNRSTSSNEIENVQMTTDAATIHARSRPALRSTAISSAMAGPAVPRFLVATRARSASMCALPGTMPSVCGERGAVSEGSGLGLRLPSRMGFVLDEWSPIYIGMPAPALSRGFLGARPRQLE